MRTLKILSKKLMVLFTVKKMKEMNLLQKSSKMKQTQLRKEQWNCYWMHREKIKHFRKEFRRWSTQILRMLWRRWRVMRQPSWLVSCATWPTGVSSTTSARSHSIRITLSKYLSELHRSSRICRRRQWGKRRQLLCRLPYPWSCWQLGLRSRTFLSRHTRYFLAKRSTRR